MQMSFILLVRDSLTDKLFNFFSANSNGHWQDVSIAYADDKCMTIDFDVMGTLSPVDIRELNDQEAAYHFDCWQGSAGQKLVEMGFRIFDVDYFSKVFFRLRDLLMFLYANSDCYVIDYKCDLFRLDTYGLIK